MRLASPAAAAALAAALLASPVRGASAQDSTAAAPVTLVATLAPTNLVGNRIVGSVKLTPNGSDAYKAEIQIRNGGGPQNKFPWIIRAGTCGDNNADILGTELAYRVLETRGDGTASINAPLKLKIPTGTYHVDVLKGTSSEDRQSIVACGPLSISK